MSGRRKTLSKTFNTKLSLVLILTMKTTKCVILLVHTNTRVGCIKKNLYGRGYDVAIFSFSFYVCLIPLFDQGNRRFDGVIKFTHFSLKCIHFLSNKSPVIHL